METWKKCFYIQKLHENCQEKTINTIQSFHSPLPSHRLRNSLWLPQPPGKTALKSGRALLCADRLTSPRLEQLTVSRTKRRHLCWLSPGGFQLTGVLSRGPEDPATPLVKTQVACKFLRTTTKNRAKSPADVAFISSDNTKNAK